MARTHFCVNGETERTRFCGAAMPGILLQKHPGANDGEGEALRACIIPKDESGMSLVGHPPLGAGQTDANALNYRRGKEGA